MCECLQAELGADAVERRSELQLGLAHAFIVHWPFAQLPPVTLRSSFDLNDVSLVSIHVARPWIAGSAKYLRS